MSEEVEKYLIDIRLCIERLEKYFKKIKSFKEFESNIMAVKATEREFQIIGEALTQIRKIDTSIVVTDMKRIIGLRNLITHAYSSVDAAQLYGIVKLHLPTLKSEVKALLR